MISATTQRITTSASTQPFTVPARALIFSHYPRTKYDRLADHICTETPTGFPFPTLNGAALAAIEELQ